MLQRFLSMLAILAALIILGNGFLPLSAQAAIHNQGNVSTPQLEPKCPDVPQIPSNGPDGTLKGPIIDFCSPKLHGNVAGPYGARIVLATENIAEQLPLWILVSGQDAVNDPGKLTNCLQQMHCFSMPAPQKLSTEGKKTVYSFTWDGNNFPTKPGDYVIEIATGKVSQPGMFIAATPVAYTLLSAQAPCITLSIDESSLNSCAVKPRNFSVQLSSTTAVHLNIEGNNWMLGWKPQDTNTTNRVQITAQCASNGQCSKKTLFMISPTVNVDGTFRTTQDLPSSTYGTYIISAINKLNDNVNQNQNDYFSSANNNSIANESLTTSTLTFSLQPPNASPLQNLSGYAIVGTIPALLGLIFFLLLLFLTRRQLTTQPVPTQIPPANTQQTHPPYAPPIYPPISNTMNNQFVPPTIDNRSEAISIDFLLKELPFLPFPLSETPQTSIPQKSRLPLLQRNTTRTIQKVAAQWQQNGSIATAEKSLSHLLYYDVTTSKNLLKQLNSAPKTPLTAPKIQEFKTSVGVILQAARRERGNRQQLCSKALIYCAALLSTSAELSYHTVLQYCMGYAYALLAANNPPTTTALLKEAELNYQTAFDSVIKYTSNDLLRSFSVILQVAIGDINTAKALVPATSENSIFTYYGLATTSYQLALKQTIDPGWKDAIQGRWNVVDYQRNTIRGKN